MRDALPDKPDSPAEILYCEFLRRREAGEPLTLEAFLAESPSHAEQASELRELDEDRTNWEHIAGAVVPEPPTVEPRRSRP